MKQELFFWNAGHNALIASINKERDVKNNESFENCMYFNGVQHYIETIEAVGSGVRYGFLDDDRFVRYGVKFCASLMRIISDIRQFLLRRNNLGNPIL